MASWALITACSGFDWDGQRGRLSFAPKVDGSAERFNTLFTTGTAQGRFELVGAEAEITVDHGVLEASELLINGRPYQPDDQGPIAAGRTVRFRPS